jgi:hypothetical protein
MSVRKILAIAVLMNLIGNGAAFAAQPNPDGEICARLLSSQGLALKALRTASQSYGENFADLETAFFASLKFNDIRFELISEIDYDGALESMPPQHIFKITLVDGTVKTIYATVPRSMTNAGFQPPVTTMPLPSTQDIEAKIDEAVSQAASAYRENAKAIRSAFDKSLAEANLNLNAIYSIKYGGALESMPPIHGFEITLTDGTMRAITAVAPIEVSPADRSPRASTLPLPRASDTQAQVATAVNFAAAAYGESADAIRLAFDASLAKENINPGGIHKVEYEGALESMPPQHMFKVTLINGAVKTVYATVP